jgi:ankyrin repeat protein
VTEGGGGRGGRARPLDRGRLATRARLTLGLDRLTFPRCERVQHTYIIAILVPESPLCCIPNMNLELPRPGPPSLLDLPDDVVAHIMCIGLSHPKDAVMLASTCHRVRRVAQTAALRLRLQSLLFAHTDTVNVLEALTALCRSFPEIQELDMSSLPLCDAAVQVSGLLELRGIAGLQLAGCTKLTSSAITTILHKLPQLRFLGAQRCFQLNVGALNAALAAATSHNLSTALFSHLDLRTWLDPGDLGLQDAAHVESNLRIIALHNCSSMRPASIRSLVTTCPRLEMLMLGGTTVAIPSARNTPSDTSLWPFDELCDYFSNAFYSLKVLELTFWPLEVINKVRSTMNKQQRHHCMIWDFRSLESVTQAAGYIRKYSKTQIFETSVSDVTQAIRAATRCCGGGRMSPLHSAAEEGDALLTDALITLGANVRGRDTRGSTPLFAACEAGHADVVARLLRAGSDPLTLNASGEGPLYIAALRGHGPVVKVLLDYCRKCDIRWENGELYGDGWTPLHAAIIGNHLKVAVQLLEAASEGCSKVENMKALVYAKNRYGQTCLHIAARKSSFEAVNTLLRAGGPALVLRVDSDGRTAIDVAKQNSNYAALRALQQRDGPDGPLNYSNRLEVEPFLSSGSRRNQAKTRQVSKREDYKGRCCGENTETGFKWVGRRLQDRRQQMVRPSHAIR